jgi:small-conductance mechanosensitive channel
MTSRLILKRLEHVVDDRSALSTYTIMINTATLVLFVVIALTVAGIPLSIFTVIGGALAIGIGFGSQNIVNNFISGLILMAEKPIKIGDIVEVGSTSGTVIEIGVRATSIKTVENKIWIIPNAKFLEEAVLNWTNNDQIVRTEVVVGVAYGSDTELVSKISLEVMQGLWFVEKSPKPRVVFDEFGDHALIFKLMFWADNAKIESYQECRSDLRFKIDKAFREHKIEISFQQKDLHIRSSIPLEIKKV